MTKRDEVILLAYVKFFEQNILKMNKMMEKGLGLLDDLPKPKRKAKEEDYNGSMFG